MTDLVEIVKALGLPVALCVFFVWIGWVREMRLAARITDLESFVNTNMLKVIAEATSAIMSATKASEKVAQSLEKLADRLAERPCWLDRNRYSLIENLDHEGD